MRRSTATEVAVVAVTGDIPPGRVAGPYRLSAGDPLAGLADGWVARWAKGDDVAFEVAAARALERKPELPDYYVVAGAGAVEGGPFDPYVLRRHWYLGFLAGLRPARVAPGDDPLDGVRMLGAGPWWPPLEEIVAAARRFRADQVGPASSSRTCG